jgi:excisionase family DNA binding protein
MTRDDDLRQQAGFRKIRDAGALSSDDGRVAACESAVGSCACGRRLPMLLSADEVAELLRTSRRAVYTMLERGQLPGAVRIGRRVLFRSDDLVGWLAECRTPSP